MTAPGHTPLRTRWRSVALPLLLGFVCFLIYNANLRQIGAGDTVAARHLPLQLLHAGSVDLGDATQRFAQGHPLALPRNRPANTAGRAAYFEPTPYWLVRTREHRVASFYPIVTPLLVTPLYVPAALWLDAHGWQQPQVDRVAELMEKLSASLLAALASVLMYLVLRREGNAWALPLTLAFAFGTDTWMISSQALWQHGGGEVLIALALLLALAPASAARIALLGAVCVLMAANRPPDGFIAAAIGAFVVARQRRSAVWLIAGGSVPFAALFYYNVAFIGDPAGGYGVVKPPANFFQQDWWGLAGLLVSPARGLLVFSPFLVFVPIGLRERLRAPGTRTLAAALALAALAQLVLYAHGDWRAGVSWGPRWLTDLLPILIWLLAPAPTLLRPVARGALVATMLAAVGVQTIGAFWYTKTSDERIFAGGTDSMRGAWDWSNIPFVTELQHAPAPAELLCNADATIDRIGETQVASATGLPTLAPGTTLEGWALACARSPAQIALLIDGVVIGSSSAFLPRPDVDAALRISAASGWRIAANLWGVPPGERVLQVALRVAPRSDFRIVREQHVRVQPQLPIAEDAQDAAPLPAETLRASAARAAALLREHQTDYGAWLTAHTSAARYDAPQPEMNTFLTALLVDLLESVAPQRDLIPALDRARTHLAAQIERDGLVRYHGLPDGPTIGTLGCAITPDADDAALVWRVAGSAADPRRPAMLQQLAGYRDARGLYRTWLAPRKRYQCIDPGTDPDPTDFTIQMHVYLMLRDADPAAAEALCGAMQRAFYDDDVWIYYAKSPLVPYLRAAELGQRGCTLPLPIERLALPADGQAIWSVLAQQLVAAGAAPPQVAAQDAARRVLGTLAADDFARLRRNPPLLYHNDLSASVRRYYWSEDVGYALWLRLYAAAGIAGETP